MNQVIVHPPRIEDDTVWFSWEDDTQLLAPPEGGLFYRFEGIDLSQFGVELWMEVFLALRLLPYACLQTPVEIRLPAPVPATVADFWTTYHETAQVRVGPVDDRQAYQPLSAPRAGNQYEWAVFFGGGRDSLATACMLGEVYGRERVLLIQCVDPGSPDEVARQQTAKRLEQRSLRPAREELGFPTQRVWTNLRSITQRETAWALPPHYDQYTAALLPALLAHNVPASTFCMAWNDYAIEEHADRLVPLRPRTRPEMLAAQSRHYQRVLGFPHGVANVHLTLTAMAAVRLLAHRYADAFPYITSCVSGPPGERWCYRCGKCGRYAFHLLAEQIEDPRFDLDRLFRENEWIGNAVQHAMEFEGVLPDGENIPAYRPGFHPLDTLGVGNMLARTDRAHTRARLGDDARFSFSVLRACYGNRWQAVLETVPAQSFLCMPRGLGDLLKPIVATELAIVPAQPEPIIGPHGIAWGPFERPFHHPLLDLPHLQEVP